MSTQHQQYNNLTLILLNHERLEEINYFRNKPSPSTHTLITNTFGGVKIIYCGVISHTKYRHK